MTTLVTTITESLRYKGKIGQWSWIFHRLSGLGILLFLIIHVIDTSWVFFYPELYEKAIEIYQTPLFTVGEFILVAAVVYHAFNGLRIALFDFRPSMWKYQAVAAQVVFLATAIVLIPAFVLMFQHVAEFYSGREFDLALGDVIADVVVPFGGGMLVALVAGVALSFVLGGVGLSAGGGGQLALKRSRFDQGMWTFMRVSGIALVVLAIGHVAIMHVVEGVFAINANGTGAAADFVAARWAFLFWRLYDVFLLMFAVIHGMNGLRYVVNDYVHNRNLRRGFHYAMIIGLVVMLFMGSVALIGGVPEGIARMEEEAGENAETGLSIDGLDATSALPGGSPLALLVFEPLA